MALKVVFMTIVGLLFYTLVDILIWQRIFEAKNLAAVGVGVYHWGYIMVLVGLIAVGAIALLPNLKSGLVYSTSLTLLAGGGWEDILYYWLDGKAIHPVLPWLSQHPLIFLDPVTSTTLLVVAVFWLIVVAGFIYFVMVRNTKNSPA